MAKTQDPREAYLEAVRSHREAVNADYAEREARSKPTPTPEELARASVGLHTDVKEDDGSGPGLIPVTKMVESDESGIYETRDYDIEQTTDEEGNVTHRRRGRPRKSAE